MLQFASVLKSNLTAAFQKFRVLTLEGRIKEAREDNRMSLDSKEAD